MDSAQLLGETATWRASATLPSESAIVYEARAFTGSPDDSKDTAPSVTKNVPPSTQEKIVFDNGVVLTYQRLYVIVAAIVLLAALWLFLRKTKFGWALRACAQDPKLCRCPAGDAGQAGASSLASLSTQRPSSISIR